MCRSIVAAALSLTAGSVLMVSTPSGWSNLVPRSVGLRSEAAEPSGYRDDREWELVRTFPAANLVDVTARGDEAWYVRADGRHGWVGGVRGDGRSWETEVGPWPAAIGWSANDLVIIESTGDGTSESPRQNLIERLDSTDGETLASSRIEDPIALLAIGDDVWVWDGSASLTRFDAFTLDPEVRLHIGGGRSASIAVAYDHLWVQQFDEAAHGMLLHRLDSAGDALDLTASIGASGVDGVLDGSDSDLWSATALTDQVGGVIRPVAPDGTIGEASVIGTPVAVASVGTAVLWLSTDGLIGAIDSQSRAPLGSLSVGTGGYCMSAYDEHVWACTDQMVLLTVGQGTGSVASGD
jgi:hypothetical protein